MKRDWDLLREQLTEIEKTHSAYDLDAKFKWSNEDETSRQLGHLKLLLDAELVDGIKIHTDANGKDFMTLSAKPRLTMSGHDFIDNLRSPKVWNKIKEVAIDKGVDLSMSSLKLLGPFAVEAIKSLIHS